MSDRTKRLVELAALAHEFFGPLAGLPELAYVRLDPTTAFTQNVSAQLMGDDGVRDVALWASEIGTSVQFVDCRDHVACFTETEFHGATVRVWTHITHSDAWRVLMGLGLELAPNTPVLVDASELLRAPSVAEAAVA